ncbi:hypothetical protein [Ruminococcus albus]|uniref:DUF4352 domain-containing protein n=1 Tax=Ruminococcus albus TaxID=1264 RepID=A0A1I1PRN4_RUMAL|nr:hypothetical protein [Ruminococcus albus]SFD12574.1 hypothetical protein SAMN02910406_03161 [Ruminococcus albus]
MKILILLTSVCLLLSGCSANSGDTDSSQVIDPDTPCLIRDSDHSVISSDGKISESFDIYFTDKNTVAIDVTVTNNTDKRLPTFDFQPKLWAETDLTPEDWSFAWADVGHCMILEAGESMVIPVSFTIREEEEGWSTAYIHVKLMAQNDSMPQDYDPNEIQFDLTVSADDLVF